MVQLWYILLNSCNSIIPASLAKAGLLSIPQSIYGDVYLSITQSQVCSNTTVLIFSIAV